ncbi:MAG: hydrogenase maturation nickel metallochaperone HypA [Candidatus Micrarchaeota archaeon]
MHEMPYVKAALSAALEGAKGGKVKRVKVEVGTVVTDLAEFRELFFMLSEGTPAGGAKLEVAHNKPFLKCLKCKKRTSTQISPIRCPKCGSPDIETNANEVKVVEIEVE